MYSGIISTKRSWKFFNQHQRMLKEAYRLFLLLKPNMAYFPDLKEVCKFEGHNGPDYIWTNGEGVLINHNYNPETGEGDALKFINGHYKELVQSLRTNNPEEICQHSAYLAHFISDMFTPPHIEERPKMHHDPHTKLGFLKDLAPDMLKTEHAQKNSRHVSFETNYWKATVGHKIRQKLPILKLDEIIGNIQAGPSEYLIPIIKQTYDMRLYRDFALDGWSKKIARKLHVYVLPKCVQTIALFWLAAVKEAKSKL